MVICWFLIWFIWQSLSYFFLSSPSLLKFLHFVPVSLAGVRELVCGLLCRLCSVCRFVGAQHLPAILVVSLLVFFSMYDHPSLLLRSIMYFSLVASCRLCSCTFLLCTCRLIVHGEVLLAARLNYVMSTFLSYFQLLYTMLFYFIFLICGLDA